MKKTLLYISLILHSFSAFSQKPQAVLIPYNNPTATGYKIEGTNTIDETVDYNDDFTVQVKLAQSPTWEDLWEYKTTLNSGSNLLDQQASSFVNFDFTGMVNVKVTCDYCLTENININDVKIRPQSEGIIPVIDNVTKTISFNMFTPKNLSVEINNDRYRGVHIFSNTPMTAPTGTYTSVADMHNNLEADMNSNNTNQLLWYMPEDNETIYIGGNEVFRGGIWIRGKQNVKIIGRGVIDQTRIADRLYNKNNKPAGYNYLNGVRIGTDYTGTIYSNDIEVNGITVNDPQNRPIIVRECYDVLVQDVKVFSRVLWGAGVYVERASDVEIKGCFLRTTDDCIPIYPMRDDNTSSSYGNSENITVSNTALYPDKARAIAIGWHGTENSFDRKIVQNVTFNQIDILEQDEHWNGYEGVMSISCGDYNYCQNITFKNINIEGLTHGSLFNIRVEDSAYLDAKEEGYRVQNITFDNIHFDRSACGEELRSTMKAINSCQYINGVRFNNFYVNNSLITSLADFDSIDLIGADYIYDITFNQTPTAANILGGTYYIKNVLGGDYLNPSTEPLAQNANKKHTVTAPWASKWIITQTAEPNVYTIRSKFTGQYLGGTTNENYVTGTCHGDFITTQVWGLESDKSNLEWKLMDLGNGKVRIVNNWMGHSSLTKSSIASGSNAYNEYVGVAPWENWYRQQWELVPMTVNRMAVEETKESIRLYPNPVKDYFTVEMNEDVNYTIRVYNQYGQLIASASEVNTMYRMYTKDFASGIYFVSIDNGVELVTKRVVVQH